MPYPPAQSIADNQAAQNRSTSGQWGLYGSHRSNLEQALAPSKRGTLRLCVLGAGNCNDLDLSWLATAYREVHLVDIDAGAVQGAIQRQKVADCSKIVGRAPIDFGAGAELFASWGAKPPSRASAQAFIDRVEKSALPELGVFDVVLSPCVLSQLIFPIREAMGADHEDYVRVRHAMRRRHLRTMLHLLGPGGEGILAVDLVSNSSFAELARVSENDLPHFMSRMIERGKSFKGLEPAAIEGALADADRARELDEVRFGAPWLWHLSLQRAFLVYCARFRKRSITMRAFPPSFPRS